MKDKEEMAKKAAHAHMESTEQRRVPIAQVSTACVCNEAERGFRFPQEKNPLCIVRPLEERGLFFYTAHLERLSNRNKVRGW